MTEMSGTPKSPLWMRISLLVSLAVNLLIAGVVAGLVFSGGPDKRADRAPRDIGTVFTRALEPEDRRALRQDFASALASEGRQPDRIVTDLETVLSSLRATPFDPASFSAALDQQSDRRKKRDELGRNALAFRIAAMSDEERSAYADRVEQAIADIAQRMRR